MKDKNTTEIINNNEITNPTNDFAQLTEYSKNGVLSSQELVQLAPTIFAGGDPSLVPSIQAIIDLKDNNPEEFNSALSLILSQRGINRVTPPAAPPLSPQILTAVPIVEATSLSNGNAAEEPEVTQAEVNESKNSNNSEAADEQDDENDIKEIVVICIDVSGSMECPFEVDDDVRTIDRTRLQAVKQCFYGFRDQTQVHKNGSKHLLGLISFSDSVKIHTYPTSNLDVFEDVIDDMKTSGMTAIFEAISVACNQILKPQSNLYPKADLRVLVLSDGLNNCNKISANDALKSLANVGAVCDCMILGDKVKNADNDLRKLVAASEGQCVQFHGLSDAYEALESPAMISLASRRNSDVEFDREAFQLKLQALSTLNQVQVAPMQRGVVRSCEITSSTHGSSELSKVSSYLALNSNTILNMKCDSGGRYKRLMKELNDYVKNPLSNVFLYPGLTENGSLTNIIKVFMIGLDTHNVYKDFGYEINIEIPNDYPFKPPKFKVSTPIYHYAISAEGGICLPVLKDAWSPSQSIKSVLSEFSDLIHDHKSIDPDCNLALRSWLSDLLRTNPEKYYNEGIQHSQSHAISISQVKSSSNDSQKYHAEDFYNLLNITP